MHMMPTSTSGVMMRSSNDATSQRSLSTDRLHGLTLENSANLAGQSSAVFAYSSLSDSITRGTTRTRQGLCDKSELTLLDISECRMSSYMPKMQQELVSTFSFYFFSNILH